MKKIMAVVLLTVALLCLFACKKSNGDSGETTTTTTTTTILEEEASHIAQKLEKGGIDSFDKFSEEDKKAIKEYAEKDGYTLEYNDDGSATISNEEGQWFVGKGWVDNEYTEGVPPLDFGTITKSSELNEGEEKSYYFLVKETSADKTIEYVDSLIAAGFAETGEGERNADAGIVTFVGENESGKHIEIAYTSNGLTMKILLKSN